MQETHTQIKVHDIQGSPRELTIICPDFSMTFQKAQSYNSQITVAQQPHCSN